MEPSCKRFGPMLKTLITIVFLCFWTLGRSWRPLIFVLKVWLKVFLKVLLNVLLKVLLNGVFEGFVEGVFEGFVEGVF